MKECTGCKKFLPEESYRLHKQKYRLNFCKKCQNRKQKLLYLKRRNLLSSRLNKYKTDYGCCCCGWNLFPEGLDLHHLDNKKETISNLLRRGACGIKAILLEISKCCIVCANCHRGLHNNRISLPNNPQMVLLSI